MSLLQMSFSGGALILAIVLLRALALYRLPKRLFPALWCLPLIRLLVPFSIPAAFSAYSLLSRRDAVVTEAHAFPVTHTSPLPTLAPDAFPGTAAVDEAAISIDPFAIVWLAGALACAVFFLVTYGKCRREFCESLPVRSDYVQYWLQGHRLRRTVSVRYSDRVLAPLTYGVFRPVILLPKSTDWEDHETLGYVLSHEFSHIRRFDTLRKAFFAAALCIHWFNPLVWVMFVLANRDMELACDEAVCRESGSREHYALALIRMEERRSGLLLVSHFSKNAIEERIKAMMKIKKTSLAAVLAALVLIGGTGAIFATSAKAENSDGSLRPGYTLESKDSILSYTDQDGTTHYSWDEGNTWTPMTDEEFAAAFPDPDVEWWAAEEYAAWLENEKQELQSIIGSRSWTSGTGWFTWTQEMVDETIAEYEEILTMIENGYLVSKTVDGDENTMLVMNPPDRVLGTGDGSYTVEKDVAEYGSEFDSFYYESLFEDYKRCGLTFQNDEGNLYWNGQRVRIFADGAEFGGGYASRYEHYDPEGTIDVRAVRELVDNGDGSYDPMGPLVRLEEFEPNQMFLDALDCQKYVDAEIDCEIGRTAPGLENLERFGLTYQFSHTGELSMTWNGQPVRSLFDPECQLWIANSLGAKGMDLEVVYKDGEITGLRESQESASVHAGAVIDAEATAAESDGDDGSGETIAQRMERYAPYGVSYQEIGGKKVIRYNGRAVRNFADFAPGGSVFSVGSADGGEINLTTVYDRDGSLSGVRAVERSAAWRP